MKITSVAPVLFLLLLSSCGGTSLMAENTDADTTTVDETTLTLETTIDTTINTDDRATGSGELNTELKKALEINKEKWALRNINSYQYTLSASCFCLNDITGKKQVTVLDGAVTEAFLLQTSQYLTPEELSRVKTVAELFTVVQQAIDTQAYQLSVSYNKDYGHPETIIIDRYKDMMDDEITYYVNDLM